MKYTLDWLIEDVCGKEKVKYLYFWGHQQSKNGSITKACLSQWWQADFVVAGITYKSAEHWMMAEKARLFGDESILEKIIVSNSPSEAKKLGRKVSNFQQDVWEKKRYDIVKEGNLHKFGQNEALKSYLLTTNSRVLVEASPVDAIWGIGMAQDHKNIHFPEKWRGLNLLGFALMEVRDELLNSK